MTVDVGALAPDFELSDQHGSPVRLSSFRGRKNVLLVFYPFAFTSVCTSELHALRDELPSFQNDRVQVLTVSVDSVFSHRVFADHEGFAFPVLSDFWPHGEVARTYGVLDEELGAATRGTFIIDTEGIVRWKVVHAVPDARDADDYRAVLATLT